MNRMPSKVTLLAVLVFGVMATACSRRHTAPVVTQIPTPVPATNSPASPFPAPTPSTVVANPTVSAVVTTGATVPELSGLRIVYIRAGNLWSWTEMENNVMLTGTGDISALRLSEDGQSLAFIRGREVWIVGMNGKDARLLASLQNEGGALWFAPGGDLLAISTTDHIEVIDLKNGTNTRVVTYPALPAGDYPQVGWSADGSGFKTVIPPDTDEGRAEFLFVFPNGKTASLAKFKMVPPIESPSFISPDGGYVTYVSKLDSGKESLYLMDSSGATRPYGPSAASVQAFGWLPDSKHFSYSLQTREQALIGNVMGEPDTEMFINGCKTIRWLDADRLLALQDGDLYLGDVNGSQALIAKDVSAFDFGKE